MNPYPYWFGYPYWYSDRLPLPLRLLVSVPALLRVLPLPPSATCGGGCPSFAFVHWFYWGHHHHHYAHLHNCFNGYFADHRFAPTHRFADGEQLHRAQRPGRRPSRRLVVGGAGVALAAVARRRRSRRREPRRVAAAASSSIAIGAQDRFAAARPRPRRASAGSRSTSRAAARSVGRPRPRRARPDPAPARGRRGAERRAIARPARDRTPWRSSPSERSNPEPQRGTRDVEPRGRGPRVGRRDRDDVEMQRGVEVHRGGGPAPTSTCPTRVGMAVGAGIPPAKPRRSPRGDGGSRDACPARVASGGQGGRSRGHIAGGSSDGGGSSRGQQRRRFQRWRRQLARSQRWQLERWWRRLARSGRWRARRWLERGGGGGHGGGRRSTSARWRRTRRSLSRATDPRPPVGFRACRTLPAARAPTLPLAIRAANRAARWARARRHRAGAARPRRA